MPQIHQIKKKLQLYVQKHSTEWIYTASANLGNHEGVVSAGQRGRDYARLSNGQVIIVYNNIAPERFDTHVKIGISKSLPGVWQVMEVREVYQLPATGFISNHAAQHMLGADDMLPVHRQQIMQFTAFVSDGPGFLVQLFGGHLLTTAGFCLVDHQIVDVSTYLPASGEGALWLNLNADVEGVVSIQAGDPIEDVGLADVTTVPIPPQGSYRICSVLLSEGLAELTNEQLLVPMALPAQELQPERLTSGTPLDSDLLVYWDVTLHQWYSITFEDLIASVPTPPAPEIPQVYEYVYETNVPSVVMQGPHFRIEGALAPAAGVGGIWIAPEDGEFSTALIFCATSGSAGDTVVDLLLNGVSIFSTVPNRPTFNFAESTTQESELPDMIPFLKGDVVTCEIITAATGAADLSVNLRAYAYAEIDWVTDDIDGSIITTEVL